MGLISRDDFQGYYWSHYLICEKDLVTLSEYVALRPGNLDTCSERIAQLFLTAVNGVESVLKILYPNLVSTVHARDFARAMLEGERFDRDQAVIVALGQGLGPIVPFGGLEDSKQGIPEWWKSHAELKHNRMEFFDKACLKNLLDSMAAYYYIGKLFMLESQQRWEAESKNCIDSFDYPDVDSSMFELVGWRAKFAPATDVFVIENGALAMVTSG